MYEKGIMLVELLLVTTLAAVIIAVGINRYQAYHQLSQYRLIGHDIVTIQTALNTYYNKQSCDQAGVIEGTINSDIIDRLAVIKKRQPYIDQYHAVIRDTGAVTEAGKPIYHLEVTATLMPHYYDLRQFLQNQLQATRFDSTTIYWSLLPNTSLSEQNNVLWVMNGSRELFKKLTNINTGDIEDRHGLCFR